MKSNNIIQELDRIARKSGGILKPENVVNEAKSPTSPLHCKFVWDDSVAAHEYRLYQARNLIRIIVNVMPNGSNEEERVWVSLHHDREQEGGGYRTLVSVLSDKDLRNQLLQEAFEDMKFFKQKYSHLSELASVFEAIKKLK